MNDFHRKDFARRWVNLASEKLGAKAVKCSDDFFAPMHRMLKDDDAVFIDGKYDDNGKWMDGWESRRKRIAGHDWCIIALAKPGIIHGIEIDTTHFTGNYPPAASIEACHSEADIPLEDDGKNNKWVEIIEQNVLEGDSKHQYAVSNSEVFTHIRVNIYPDGGIARLRVYAQPRVNWEKLAAGELVDIAAALNGGVALAANNEHFGGIRNLLTPGRGVNMGDGWETRRRREPGNDWVVIALARRGKIREIEIDTAHYKGNYPESCNVLGANLTPHVAANMDWLNLNTVKSASENWDVVLNKVKLQADKQHYFKHEIIDAGLITHIRINIFPDGGLSRVRMLADIHATDIQATDIQATDI